jgi:hypothetical protein
LTRVHCRNGAITHASNRAHRLRAEFDARGACILPRRGAPARDAGDNAAVPPDVLTDVAGNARIRDGIVDIGAFEDGDDHLLLSEAWDASGEHWPSVLADLGLAFVETRVAVRVAQRGRQRGVEDRDVDRHEIRRVDPPVAALVAALACNVADIVAANVEIFSPGNTSICSRQPVPGP